MRGRTRCSPAMWRRVADVQDDFDVVVNLAYDWLPLYLTRYFCGCPSFTSSRWGRSTMSMDRRDRRRGNPLPWAARCAQPGPGRHVLRTPPSFRIVGNGIVTERYDVRLTADDDDPLGFVGRISPEKGLEDVAELSERTQRPSPGVGHDAGPRRTGSGSLASIPLPGSTTEDFCPPTSCRPRLGRCAALVMTPKWVEAFGNVAIEAMATGVPVITYDRGGPAEIVIDGETGFVVPADDVDALVRRSGPHRRDRPSAVPAACRRACISSARHGDACRSGWIIDVLARNRPDRTQAHAGTLAPLIERRIIAWFPRVGRRVGRLLLDAVPVPAGAVGSRRFEASSAMATYTPKASEITRDWHVVDAEGMVLGRMATEVARLLRGKHKPIFSPHMDTGDHVIIINADKVIMTSDKADRQMIYTPQRLPGRHQVRIVRPLPRPQARRRRSALGARHAPEGPARSPAAHEAQGVRRTQPSARVAVAQGIRNRWREASLRTGHTNNGNSTAHPDHRPSQGSRRTCVAPPRHRAVHRSTARRSRCTSRRLHRAWSSPRRSRSPRPPSPTTSPPASTVVASAVRPAPCGWRSPARCSRLDPESRATLKKAGLLTRDSRKKESKKYGLKKARKAPQFTKR